MDSENSGGNQGGKFRPGQSGNPTGKPRGARRNTEAPPTFVPSPQEAALMREWREHRQNSLGPPRMKVESTKGKIVNVRFDHPEQAVAQAALCRSLGTHSTAAADWLLATLVNSTAVSNGAADERTMNCALAILHELKPRDELESMLVAQMIATHALISDRARSVRHAETINQLEANGTLLTKLQRTFIQQVEALQRYRGKGPQVVRVERVHVHEGGQAIVGTVQTGGGVPMKSEGLPHAQTITHAPGQTLPSEIETVGEAVSVASS